MSDNWLELPVVFAQPAPARQRPGLAEDLASFAQFGQATRQGLTTARSFSSTAIVVPTFVNEFWTARQRQANSLHEISYRACFKPQLPRFFIERLSLPGERVYDPFMGRGTTLLEAALLGRVPVGCDINPLSAMLTWPRLRPPSLAQVERRLAQISFADHEEFPADLLVFYHPETLKEIVSLKRYLVHRHRPQARQIDRPEETGGLAGRDDGSVPRTASRAQAGRPRGV